MPTHRRGHVLFKAIHMEAPVRVNAKFSGRVQGVGFRYTTVGLARGFDVTGYVRNLPDGRVELVAEGSPSQTRAFVAAVMERMAGYVDDTVSHQEPPTGEFSGFEVRY